jgi:hypothetical protein
VNLTAEPGTLDIEAVWPIDRAAAGAGRIHGGSLPNAFGGRSNHLALPSMGQDPTEVF